MEPLDDTQQTEASPSIWQVAGAFALPLALVGFYLLIKAAVTGAPVSPGEIRFFLMALFAMVAAHAVGAAACWARLPARLRAHKEDILFFVFMGFAIGASQFGTGLRHWDILVSILAMWIQMLIVMGVIGVAVWSAITFWRSRPAQRGL